MANTMVVGGQVTGNVGSCKSDSIEVTTQFGWFYKQTNTIVTNSCTGQVTEYKQAKPGPVFELGAIVVCIALLIAMMGATIVAIAKLTDR